MLELLLRGDKVKTDAVLHNNQNAARHIGLLNRYLAIYKAKRQAKKIIKGLNEAKEIHAGRKQAKSFDDFLSEI